MPTLSLILATCLSTPVVPSQDPTPWLLVRSRSERVGTLAWERIGDVYLADREWRLVGPDEPNDRSTSRMVVGRPDDHPQVAELAAGLGVDFEAGALRVSGRAFDPGTGYAAWVPDPDGTGILFLVCAPDPEGLFACFRTSLDLGAGQYAVARGGAVVERGVAGLTFDLEQPSVVRLDRDLLRLLEATADLPRGERTLRVARGLAGYGHVYARLGAGDLLAWFHVLLGDLGGVARARELFAGRDLDAEVRDAWRRTAEALEDVPRPPAPSFYLLYGSAEGTNAMTFDPDPVTHRPQVLFNLTALARGRHLDAALVHECVHPFQDLSGTRLIDRAWAEGVASLVSQRLAPGLSDADALLWSAEELAAAEARREPIVAAFRSAAEETHRAKHVPWLTLGVPLEAVPGAPSRTGYWVAWLAARAWLGAGSASGGRGLGDLLRADPEEALAELR